jgi:hypothetical protein
LLNKVTETGNRQWVAQIRGSLMVGKRETGNVKGSLKFEALAFSAKGKRQKAKGKRQKAKGKRQSGSGGARS